MTNDELRIMNGGSCRLPSKGARTSIIPHSSFLIPHSSSGFTVLELLVASLLLGMLMTILTMIFNQSSIAWRTGLAGERNRGGERRSVSDYRYESDNAYPDMNGKLLCVRSVFEDDGTIRTDELIDDFKSKSIADISASNGKDAEKSFKTGLACNGSSSSGNPDANYVVNVMSAGPDMKMDTYDDIWSFPDDPSEW